MSVLAPALRAHGVHVSLGGQEVLHGVDVTFVAGRWTDRKSVV